MIIYDGFKFRSNSSGRYSHPELGYLDDYKKSKNNDLSTIVEEPVKKTSPNKGKPLSEEHKEKLRQAAKANAGKKALEKESD